MGSDITAGMVSCGFLEEEDDSMAAGRLWPKLYIDIGTNGEIGLINGKALRYVLRQQDRPLKGAG